MIESTAALRRQGTVAALAGAGAAGCGIGLLATSGWLITRASERPPVFALSVAIGAVQAFALTRGVLRYVERLGIHGMALEVLGRRRLWLFDRLAALVPGTSGLRAGTALTGCVADADLVAQGVVKRSQASIDIGASVVLGGALVAAVAPSVAVALVLAALLTTAVSMLVSGWGRRAAEREAVQRGDLADAVLETAGAARELVAFGRSDLLEARLAAIARRDAAAGRRRAVATGLSGGAARLVAGAGVILVLIRALALQRSGQLSGVMVAVVVFAALAVLESCASLPALAADLQVAGAAGGRLAALGRMAPAAIDRPDDDAPPVEAGEARFDEVTVERDGVAVISDLTAVVPAGGAVALVGPSGSGKTTALHALLHFVSCAAGRITVSGADVAHLSRAALAARMGWVPDRTHLFCSSLRENLRLANPWASDADCRGALERVGLAGWLATLPDGLDTALGTSGRPTSAGERQRIGLARVLLARAPVLLLDEPTAHLDPGTGPLALGEVVSAAAGRSLLVVTHDPAVANLVDGVVECQPPTVPSRAPSAAHPPKTTDAFDAPPMSSIPPDPPPASGSPLGSCPPPPLDAPRWEAD